MYSLPITATITNVTKGTTYTNADIVDGSLSLNKYCTSAVTIEFGNVTAGELQFMLADVTTTISLGDDLTIQFASDQTSDTFHFIVTGIKEDESTLQITALDKMILLDSPANLSAVTYPLTAQAFVDAVYGTGLGFTISYQTGLHNPTIDDPVFEASTTYRQVLSKVCECMGACADFYDGTIYIGFLEDIEEELTDTEYTYCKLGKQGYEVVVEVTQDLMKPATEIVDDTIYLRIVGNQFFANKTDAERTAIASAIQAVIDGELDSRLLYGGSLTLLPNPDILPLQLIAVEGKLIAVTEVTFGINENTKIDAKLEDSDNSYNFGFSREIVKIQSDITNIEGEIEPVVENNKHFFYRDDSGVHITMVENDYNSGNNLLIDSDSVDVRQGTTTVASFGSETRIGEQGKSGVAFNASETVFYDAQGSVAGRITQGSQEDKELEKYTVLAETTIQNQDGFTPPSFSRFKPLPYTPISDISVYIVCSSNYLNPALATARISVPTDGTAVTQTLDVNTTAQGTTLARLEITIRYATFGIIGGLQFIGNFTSVVTPSGELPYVVIANATYTYTGEVPMFLFGKGLQASEPYSFIVGQYNEDNMNLFAVGNGSDISDRHNVFEVDLNGATTTGDFAVVDGWTTLEELSATEIRASGDITSEGNIYFDNTNRGIFGLDYTNYAYPLICDNGTNLWIGAGQTATQHHEGRTFISSGYSTSDGKGYDSIFVSVPNATNTNATNYTVWHSGNLNVDRLVNYYTPSITTEARVGQTTGSYVAIRVNGSQFGDIGLTAESNTLYLWDYDTNSAVWEMKPSKFMSGETYTAMAGAYSGHITSGSTDVVITIPLPRSCAGMTVTQTAKVACTIRGIGGYLDDSYSQTNVGATSAYTWSVTDGENAIRLSIRKSSAYSNATNNTPVSVIFRGKVTFRFT